MCSIKFNDMILTYKPAKLFYINFGIGIIQIDFKFNFYMLILGFNPFKNFIDDNQLKLLFNCNFKI